MKCPRQDCGGDLSFDRDEEKWTCSLCDRSWTPEELKALMPNEPKQTRRKRQSPEPIGFFYFNLTVLSDEEFDRFWSALGRVIRARITRERKAG